MSLRTFMSRVWLSHLPWLALCMVLVLVLMYVVSLCGPYEAFAPKDARDTPPDDAALPKCLTKRMLAQYENAANDMLQALKMTMTVSDEFAAKKTGTTEVTTQGAADADKSGAADATPVEDPPVGDGTTSAMAVDTQGGIQTDTMPDMGDGASFSAPSPNGIETFAPTVTSPCVVKPKSIEWAHKQLKERPLALLKAYNQLRERVNKGIDGFQRIKEMQKEQEVAEEAREAQTEAILQAGEKEGDDLNRHYETGGDDSASPF